MTLNNLEQRRSFVERNPCLSHEAVQSISGRRLALKPNDYFAVQLAGEKLYPAFQFDGQGIVKPSIKTIMSAMSGSRTAWKIAFWLVGEAPHLDGRRPVDMLNDHDWIKTAVTDEMAINQRRQYHQAYETAGLLGFR